jgi:phosphate acetyltransferase
MEYIENRPFDEIQVGDSASLKRRLTMGDIKLFAIMSGDVNPAHVDEDYAKSSRFHEIIAHGMWGGALISTLLGTRLPGPGTIYLDQTLSFKHPIGLGDVLTVTVTAQEKDAATHRIVFLCECHDQDDNQVITGKALVIAPTEKIKRPRAILPEVHLCERAHLHRLLNAAREFPAVTTAVVHPVERESLLGAIEAAVAGIIKPILVGPERKIRQLAEAEGVDLQDYRIVPARHSHAAAEQAVQLVHSGKAEVLMKGALHTDELMRAVLNKTHGLRSDRRLSHVYVFDVPTYAQPLFITDAGINIAPGLETMRDIIQNAIDLAHILQIEHPKVAILSAIEKVDPKFPSTVVAAALCKMADRKQITGGLIDGPMAFDTAVSAAAAHTKGLDSPVAGQADILVVPDIEAGNMLAKQLEYLGGAEGAGIVVGARAPIVLTSRADDSITRMASCAIALMMVHHGNRSIRRRT